MTQRTPSCPASDPPLGVLLARAAGTAPGSRALDFLGRKSSAANLATAVSLAAADLMRLGVDPGSPVAVMLPPSPAIFVAALALEALGATLVPLDPDAPIATLAKALTVDPVDLLITADLDPIHGRALDVARLACVPALHVMSYVDMLTRRRGVSLRLFSAHRLARTPPQLASRVTHERELRRLTGVRPTEPLDPVAAERFSIRLQTHATADRLTTATLTSANLAASRAQLEEALPSLRPGQELIVSTLPLWHPLSLVVPLGLALSASAELIILDDASPAALSRAVERRSPTVIIASPEHLWQLLHTRAKARAALSQVRLILVTGRPASNELRLALTRATPALTLDLHLLTTVATILAVTDCEDRTAVPACRPLGRARISIRDIADPSREVARGERGEITCSGPHIPTAVQMTPAPIRFLDDAFWTGELGSLNTGGMLHPVDRVDDLIMARGYLIFPRRIEAALLEHADIAEAAVHALPAPGRNSVSTATLVVKPGSVVTQADVQTHLESRISRIEMPETITFASSLPKTPFGAIDKAALRKGGHVS
jgi:long-chain acyl-CoA synthetase